MEAKCFLVVLLLACVVRAQNTSSVSTLVPVPTATAAPTASNGTINANYCGFSNTCSSEARQLVSKSAFGRGDSALVLLNVIHTVSSYSQNYTVDDNSTLINGTETILVNATSSAQFFPIVDQFTVLQVPNSLGVIVNQQPFVTLAVATNGGLFALAPARQWYSSGFYVGFRSAYITLNQGAISAFTWDDGDGCSSCSSTELCIDNACGLPVPTTNCSTSCNIKIYLTWIGTDSNGRQMISGSYAYSQFQSWWPFAQDTLNRFAANLYYGLGNGGFSELSN